MMKQYLTREMILDTLHDESRSDESKASVILALANQDQLVLLNRVSNTMSQALDDVQDNLNQSFMRDSVMHEGE